MNLKIVLSQDRMPLLPALRALKGKLPAGSIDLYCLEDTGTAFEQATAECENLKKSGEIASFCIFTRKQFDSVFPLANHCFLADKNSFFLLFLSSDVILELDAAQRLMASMSVNDNMAGANPILQAGWLNSPEKRAAYMGLVFDCQKKLHFLYECILLGNALARKARFFQLGHPGCLLLRGEDFQKAGGLRSELGFLAFPGLCFEILKFRPDGFACVPEARGILLDKFQSWSFCGLWNSILQRGRLDTGHIIADYPLICGNDQVEYGCDAWLSEGPAQIPDLAKEQPERSWQEWRYFPKPATLLSYLASLSRDEKLAGLELAQNRPASLPQTLQYYKVQAKKVKSHADARGYEFARQIGDWQTRIRRFHYGELRPGIELLKKAGIYNCALDACPAVYDAWIELAENFQKLEIAASWPQIAVVMPVWNPRPEFLRQAIESVLGQTYSEWQLCIADDASTSRETRLMLEAFASRSERILLKFRSRNGHICKATNTALELVKAPFSAFLDHDDLLSSHALAEVAFRIAKKPELGFIYSDEDRISEDNVRRTPIFKPDYDCDLFSTGHLSVYRTALLRDLGGLRCGTEGAQDQDLRFRVTETLSDRLIAHIPRILYHWRVHKDSTAGSYLAKPYVVESSRRVYLEAAARKMRVAEWPDKSRRKLFRLLYYPTRKCTCSVLILEKERRPSSRLLETVQQLKKYADIEVGCKHLFLSPCLSGEDVEKSSLGAKVALACNEAAEKMEGEILLFLWAGLEPEGVCRLEQLLELVMLPHIAMASGNIWHNGRLLYGGWYPNADGLPFPLLQGMGKAETDNAAWGQLCQPRHVLGVPWQCMAVKRELCVNGAFLDDRYGAFATVDFTLKAMKRGLFSAMNPWVNWRLDSIPVSPDQEERKVVFEQWGTEIANSGLRNPNLRAAPDRDWTIII